FFYYFLKPIFVDFPIVCLMYSHCYFADLIALLGSQYIFRHFQLGFYRFLFVFLIRLLLFLMSQKYLNYYTLHFYLLMFFHYVFLFLLFFVFLFFFLFLLFFLYF